MIGLRTLYNALGCWWAQDCSLVNVYQKISWTLLRRQELLFLSWVSLEDLGKMLVVHGSHVKVTEV